MKEEMETQRIIITGGATRIGAAIAESLATHKNQITIHYNKSKKKAEKLKKKLKKKFHIKILKNQYYKGNIFKKQNHYFLIGKKL